MAKIFQSPHLYNVIINWTDESVYDIREKFNCKQIITIDLNKNAKNNKDLYTITYEWIYDEDKPNTHPFYYDNSGISDYTSLLRTKESDSLVKYLIMSDIELAKYSGSIKVSRFRRDIIIAIAHFWKEGGKIKKDNRILECFTNNFRIYLGDGKDSSEFGGNGWTVKN